MTTPRNNISVHFSSLSNEWQTPLWLFSQLNQEFGFNLDAAATAENNLCQKFYTAEMDALKQDWAKDGTTVWLNPPYGRLIGKFVKKAFEETTKSPRLTVVMLIPARTDTRWWHDYCSKGEIRLIRGRLKFINASFPSYRKDGDFKTSPAPFPSAIVVLGAKSKSTISHVTYKDPTTKKMNTNAKNEGYDAKRDSYYNKKLVNG